MVSETSFDLAYLETRRSYNEVVQQLRRVLGEHYSPDLLVKHEEQVVKKAHEVTIATMLKTSPNQAVSPDCYLMHLGHALWYCCRAKLRVPKETWPPMPAEFDVEGMYDPSKGGAPEHIRAKREAAEREIEEDRLRKEKGKGKAVEGPSSQQMPIRAKVPTPIRPQFVPRVAQPVAPGETQGGPSTRVPVGLARSMWADEVLALDQNLLQEQKKKQQEIEEAAKNQGKTYAQMIDRPVVEKFIPAVADEQGGRRMGAAQHLEVAADTAAAPTQLSSGPSGGQNDQASGLLPGQLAQLQCRLNVEKQKAQGLAVASVQVPKPEPVRRHFVPHKAQSLMVVHDRDDALMASLWDMYDLGSYWPVGPELQPWEVKILASSHYLVVGRDNPGSIFDFTNAAGPGRIYTRTIRNDWLVIGLTVKKPHRWSVKTKEANLAVLLYSLQRVFTVMYEWAHGVSQGSQQSLVAAMDFESMRLPLVTTRVTKEKKEEVKRKENEKKDEKKNEKDIPHGPGNGAQGEVEKEIEVVREHAKSVLDDTKSGASRRESLIAFVERDCGDLKHLDEDGIVNIIRETWENGTLYKGEEKEKTEAKDFVQYFTKKRAVSKAKKLVQEAVATHSPNESNPGRSKRVAALLKEVKNWKLEGVLSRDEVAGHMFDAYKNIYSGEIEQEEAKAFKSKYTTLKEQWEREAEKKAKGKEVESSVDRADEEQAR
ncbi:hypothetical protein VPNG_09715 [Cytospora leucostoma]|uniref:Uncharacterized protein n=1 Tax=Cytospora leucostoma TaxID=1230097 RepID=A0A423VKN1_9PEZI|nr:hypothetical protein VPNG_09715 [Cytospora leucostoma]